MAIISSFRRFLREWIACYRLEGDTYRHVLTGEGASDLVHADWPDLTISLADLWR